MNHLTVGSAPPGGNDTQRGRAVAIMNALLGTGGRKGGFFLPTSYPVPKVAAAKPITHTFREPDAGTEPNVFFLE